MGSDYICSYLSQALLSARALDRFTQGMAVREHLECSPNTCNWLEKIVFDLGERVADLCLRLGYGGRASPSSAITCLLDDECVLHLLPSDGDLAEQMRKRLPEFLVALTAYVSIHVFFGQARALCLADFSNRLPPDAIRFAGETSVAHMAVTQTSTLR